MVLTGMHGSSVRSKVAKMRPFIFRQTAEELIDPVQSSMLVSVANVFLKA